MGVFNTLTADVECPFCGALGRFRIQFKYGSTWQHEYKIGDSLRWGGNDIGIKTLGTVRVESIGGPCPHCKKRFIDFDVFVRGNQIVKVDALGDRPKSTPDEFEIISDITE